MATIITQKQPSWQLQLAANILGPLVGNFINKAIERSENAYNNKRLQAALAETNSQPEPQVNILGMSNPLMQQSGNGWENAARQGMNALADFDMNTANLASPMIATTQPTPARMPTVAEMQAALIRHSGHASLPTLQAQYNPYIQAQEAARVEQRKREAGEAIANASPDNRFAEVWRHLPVGDTTIADVNAAYSQYKDTLPQAYNLDTGGQLIQGNRNPVTGEYTPQMTTNRTLTPQQIRDNDYRDRALTQQNNQFIAGQDFTRSENELNRKHALRIAEINAQNKGQYKFHFNKDGSLWRTNQNTGLAERIENPDAFANTLPVPIATQYKVLNQNLRTYETQYVQLQRQKTEMQTRALPGQNIDTTEIDGKIQAKEAEIQKIKDDIALLLNGGITTPAPTQPTPTNKGNHGITIGQSLIPEGFSGRYESKHKFGHDRKTHKHAGVDLLAKEGSPIKAASWLGSNLRVVDISDDPDDSSHYGCHVRLEGTTPDGYKYYYIFGHMQKGSIKVKKGDIINPGTVLGKIGSTGRSTAPHLHFEIRPGGRGGKPIDPEKFFAQHGVTPAPIAEGASVPMQSEDNGQQTTTPPVADNQGGNTNQTQQQEKRRDDSPTAWYNPTTGAEITQNEYAKTASAIENGEVPWAKTTKDFDTELERRGFKRRLLNNPEDSRDWRPGYQRPNGVSNQYANIPSNSTSPDVIISQTPQVVATHGETSGDITLQSPDIGQQPQIATVPTTTQSPDVTPQLQDSDPIVVINPNTAGKPDIIRQSDIDEWERRMNAGEQPTKSIWNKRGVHTRDDFIRWHLANGYQSPNNNDANLANIVGTIGDTTHSPGPVHNNETPETQQQELNYLNGEDSGDVTPAKMASPSWSAFFQRPYNLGSGYSGMPSRYANNIRRYNIR